MAVKSITTNGIYAVSAKIFGMLVPMLVMPYILRTLGVESYGRIAYVESLVSYFVLAATLGIADFSMRECSVIRHDKVAFSLKISQIFTISLAVTGVSYTSFLLYSAIVSDAREDFPLYFIFSFTILGGGMLMDWLYKINERFDLISGRDILGKAVYLILCFLLISKSEDYILYGAIFVFSYTIIPLTINHYNIWKGNCEVIPHLQIDNDFLNNMKSIAYLGLMTLGSKLFSSSDVILTKWLSNNGNEAVGLYNSGIVIPLVIEQMIFVIVSVITPQLYKYLGQHDEKSAQLLSNKVSNIMYFVAVPSVIICVVFSSEILYVLGGDNYLAASPVLKIYSLILLSSVAITLAGTRTYVARKKEKKLFKILISMAIVNITLDYFFIREWGVIGAAIATTISNFLLMSIELTLERSWHFVFTMEKWRYVFGGVIIIAVFMLTKNICLEAPVLTFICSVVIAGIVYSFVMYYMHESTMMIVTDKLKRVKRSYRNGLKNSNNR